MNLNFNRVGTHTINGIEYIVYRACVHHSAQFWYTWKKLSDHDRKKYVLKKENNLFYLYKFVDENKQLFSLSKKTPGYSLQNTSKLFPYQKKAVEYLTAAIIHNGSGVDGSDTGTGKTYTALAVCRELDLQPGVICKKSGIADWKQACKYMGIVPFFIVNWEYAKSGKLPYIYMYRDRFDGQPRFKYGIPRRCILIFDECHVANNTGTINNRLYVSSYGLKSISISATLADKPSRLAYLIYILGIMHPDTYRDWLRDRGAVDIRDGIESFSDMEDMRELHKLIFPRYGYRMSINDPQVKAYFPTGIYNVKLVNIPNRSIIEQNKIYEKLTRKIKELKGGKERQSKIFTEQLRYRQLSEYLKIDSIIELTNDYIEQNKSVIIFVNFLDTLKELSRKLKTNSLIFGEQEKYKINRERVINDFQSDKTRIIISVMGAGGYSINLHDVTGEYSRISLICPSWDAVQLFQTLGRTYRAASRSIPVMQLLYSAGTIEERVARRVQEKINNIRSLNTGDLIEDTIFNMN